MPADTLTGAALVEAGARSQAGRSGDDPDSIVSFTMTDHDGNAIEGPVWHAWRQEARDDIRAILARAGVDAEGLERAANDILDLWTRKHGPIAALLRALAEVQSDD